MVFMQTGSVDLGVFATDPVHVPTPSARPSLDENQLQVVMHRRGRGQVRAVPGAGKTTLLIAFVEGLVADGWDPASIYVATHTNAAADEFSNRLQAALGRRTGKAIPVRTIHSHARSWVQQHRRVEVLPEDRQNQIWAQVLGRPSREYPWAIGPVNRTVAEIRAEIASGNLGDEAMAAKEAYQRAKRELGLADFDDLLEMAMEYAWEVPVDALVVDEAQDCSREQFALLDAIPAKVCLAVGDTAQAIFGFGGARPDLLAKFGGQEYRLERSWRLPRKVARAAEVVLHNGGDDIRIVSGKGHSGRVLSTELDSGETEANWVADQVANLVRLDSPPSVLVIARQNADLQPISLALRAREVPHNLEQSKVGWWDLPETAGLVDASRVQVNPKDSQALCRLALWPVFPSDDVTEAMHKFHSAETSLQIDVLRKIAKPDRLTTVVAPVLAGQPVAEVFGNVRVVSLLGGQTQVDRARDRLAPAITAWRCAGDPERFLGLVARESFAKRKQSLVRLASAHASKGGEADVVIVIGTEVGRWPHKKSVDEPEERRVFYVALTRAKQIVCFTRARRRGRIEPGPSPYLVEMKEAGAVETQDNIDLGAAWSACR